MCKRGRKHASTLAGGGRAAATSEHASTLVLELAAAGRSKQASTLAR